MKNLPYKIGAGISTLLAILSFAAPANAAFIVPQGGTGLATITAHYVLVGNGTGNIVPVSPGTSGYVLTSNGTGSDPSFQSLSSSFSGTAPISVTSGVIAITQADTSHNGYLTSTDWNTFNGKQSALTFSTGLTNTAGTITVNTAQNIATLSNLTTNGFVKTTGASGALSVDTNTYLTGNQSVTLTGDITGSGSTAITTTLKNTGTAGTYRSTTFDAMGRETSGTNPTTFSGYSISDTSANLASALTDETGTGLAVFNASPTFSGLATFANASSTFDSVFKKFYVGGTSTTTIDSVGNIVIPSAATLTNTGKSDGCASWSSGVLTSSGTACGSGSGTVTSVTLASPNSTLSLGGTNPVTVSGTINADLNLAHSNAFTSLQSFLNASSTFASVTSKLYVGGTATTTIDSSGNTAVAGTLNVTGATTLATSLSGFLKATSGVISAASVDLTANVTGTLPVGNGGTGATTFSSSQVLYGAGANPVQSVATSSISVSPGLTNTGTLGSQIGGSTLTLKQIENKSFSYATTTWGTNATTTIRLNIGYGEVWNTMKCVTDAGTLNVDFYHASSHFPFLNASTTKGTVSMGATTDTSGDTVSVDIGTPASSPTYILCTLNDTI